RKTLHPFHKERLALRAAGDTDASAAPESLVGPLRTEVERQVLALIRLKPINGLCAGHVEVVFDDDTQLTLALDGLRQSRVRQESRSDREDESQRRLFHGFPLEKVESLRESGVQQ